MDVCGGLSDGLHGAVGFGGLARDEGDRLHGDGGVVCRDALGAFEIGGFDEIELCLDGWGGEPLGEVEQAEAGVGGDGGEIDAVVEVVFEECALLVGCEVGGVAAGWCGGGRGRTG